MSVSTNSEILDRVEQLLAEAGVEGERNLLRGELWVLYELPSGRTQEVYICDSTTDPEVPIISVRSTCVVLDKGMFKGVNKPMLLELLLTNERLNFARFGLLEDEKSYIVVASDDLLVNGLETRGLCFALECVALAADGYEERFDQDEF